MGNRDQVANRDSSSQVSLVLRAAPAAIAALSGLIYLGSQLGLPAQRGPDAAYYLIGCEHMAAGLWPWASEPPLAFLTLYPVYRLLPGPAAFTIVSALWGAAAVYALGLLARDLYLAQGGGQPQKTTVPGGRRRAAVAGIWGSSLAFGFMVLCFASGLFKNAVANVFMILALRALVGRRWGAFAVLTVMAALSHPGAAATLLLASCCGVAMATGWQVVETLRGALSSPLQGADRRSWLSSASGAGRLTAGTVRHRPLVIAAVTATLVVGGLAMGRSVAPTFLRYLGSYLGQGGGGQGARPALSTIFGWDFPRMFFRYLPLWPLAAAALARRRNDDAHPASAVAMLTLGSWVVLLLAMTSMGGLVSPRFEAQLFIPLVALAAVQLASAGSHHRRRTGGLVRAAGTVLMVMTLVYGLAIQGGTIARSTPALDQGQVAALRELDAVLPQDAVLCTFMTDARYWVEYLTRRPVLSRDLARERVDLPGPLYVLLQDPTAYGSGWDPAALAQFRADGLLEWEREGFILLRGRRVPGFFETWLASGHHDDVIRLIDGDLPPVLPAYSSPRANYLDRAVGWVLFAPLGIGLAAGLSPAYALAAGLPVTAALWGGIWHVVSRRRNRHHRHRHHNHHSVAVTPTAG